MTTLEKDTRNTPWGPISYLLFVVLLVVVLFYGRELLVPLIAGAFFAMLMTPVSGWLEKKLKRPFAVIICVFILLVFILGIFAIIIAEINSFTDDLPAIEKKSNEVLHSMEQVVQQNFGVEPERQTAMLNAQIKSAGQTAGKYLGSILSGTAGVLGALVISLVYTFLLLYHRERYESFFIKLFGKKDPVHTKEVIDNLAQVGQHYIKGRTISVLLLWLIYGGGFLIIGLKSAILLGAIAALLSIIPYVGGIIGGIFPFFMALATGDSSGTAVGVLIVVVVAHGLSTYIIEPMVVGGRLKLSGLSMIVVIIAGNALWGIPGMILFTPLLAMAKILFDNIPSLQPYGYLVSDPDEGKSSKIDDWFAGMWKRIFRANKHSKGAKSSLKK